MNIEKERTEQLLVYGLNGAIAFVIAAATYFVLSLIVGAHIFGPDESVYLTKARSWISGTPADQWEVYRPMAMSIIGWILLHFDDSERFIRITGVLWGAGTAAVVFLLFRRITNLWIGLVVAFVTVASSLFLSQAPLFLDDISSSGFLFAVLLVIYIHYQSDGASNSIYLAAPFAALAFYLRYGVVTAFIMICVASAIFLAPRFIRKPSTNWTKLGRTVFIAVLLFLPHFIHSLTTRKELFGILEYAGQSAHRVYLGEGLIQYIKWLPAQIGGWPLGVSAIAGVAVLVVLVSKRELRQHYVGLTWIGSIGLGTFLITGTLVHAEPRYIFFSMVLLAGTGIAGTYYAIEKWSTHVAYAFLSIVVSIAAYFGLHDFRVVADSFKNKTIYPTSVAYMQALEMIRVANPSHNCTVWSGLNAPQASWYSECNIFKVVSPKRFATDAEEYPDSTKYSIAQTKLKTPQISDDNAQEFGVVLNELYRVPNLPNGDLILYRIVDLRETRTVPMIAL